VATIHTQWIGNKAILPKEELEQLIKIAKESEEIELRQTELIQTKEIVELLEKSGTFDFWKEEAENIYTMEDGEAI